MKKKIAISICVLFGIVLGFIAITIATPFSINGINSNYTYEEFINSDFKISAPFYMKKANTIWTVNSYDFMQGSEAAYLPVIAGDNTITITNGSRVKSYTFNIDTADTLLIPELAISEDDMDYAGDGIGNKTKKELGLSTHRRDSAGDGLYDNVKIAMGLDPLEKYDYYEVREYKVFADYDESSGIYLTVNGIGNIGNTFVDVVVIETLEAYNGFAQSDIVRISTSNKEKPESMKITFAGKKNKYNESEHSIYSLNWLTNEVEELDTIFTETEASANIDSFMFYYFLGKKQKAPDTLINQVYLLIDNSGSMFASEYVAEKNKTEIKEEDNFGNDIDFNRLSLMDNVVNALGTEDYTFAVSAFTGDFYKLNNWSTDVSEISQNINSLRTEYQNFNGTALYSSISKAAKEIDANQYGAKFLIVLTDGHNSEGGGLLAALFATQETTSFELENIKKKGIRIISIGLGDDLNFAYLQKIAAQTNGKYIHVKDANALNEVLELLTSAIKNSHETINRDNVIVVGDSGFRASVDGFNFENFGSIDSPGGNCYGFSYLTRDIYLSLFKSSGTTEKGSIWNLGNDFRKIEDLTLIAYELTELNKTRLSKGSIYNITLDKWYKYYTDTGEQPVDYRTAVNGVAELNQKYRLEFTKRGIIPAIVTVDKPVEIKTDGKEQSFLQYESINNCLNCFDAVISNEFIDDYQVLQLINRSQRVQMQYPGRNLFIEPISKTSMPTYGGFILPVMLELQSGSPVMLGLTAPVGGHAVLATKMSKKVELETFFLYIYDSNEPGNNQCIATLTREVALHELFEYPVFSSSYLFIFSAGGHNFTKVVRKKLDE